MGRDMLLSARTTGNREPCGRGCGRYNRAIRRWTGVETGEDGPQIEGRPPALYLEEWKTGRKTEESREEEGRFYFLAARFSASSFW